MSYVGAQHLVASIYIDQKGENIIFKIINIQDWEE